VTSALGLDVFEEKMALWFWQGSSENPEIDEALFRNLERRGLGALPEHRVRHRWR